MWDSHCDTQHPVGVGRGTADCATRLMIGQHRDRCPTGDETHQGIHMRRSLGYTVWETELESRQQRGGFPSSRGNMRDEGLRECGALDRTW